MIRLNKDKHIGRVLFVVEGGRYEFSLLQKIFVDIFHYDYLEKRRDKPDRFISGSDHNSRIAVVNASESNIRDITENPEYLDEVFTLLTMKYDYPVDQSAIYYLFDRDPESNTDTDRIREYIDTLRDPYDNGNLRAGQLLLSYPSIESYTITAFNGASDDIRFILGRDAKNYISANPEIQLNKLGDDEIISAANVFLEYMGSYVETVDIDDFAPMSKRIFEEQEIRYMKGEGYRLISMLTLAFLQMGIIDLDGNGKSNGNG